MASRRDLLKAACFGAATGAVGKFGFDAYTDRLVVERKTLSLPRWTASGLKVALLADMHANRPRAVQRARRALDLAAEERPDCVVLAGDFIDFTRSAIEDDAAMILEPIRNLGVPVLAIMGNHDYWSMVPERVVAALKGAGAQLLRNEVVEVGGVAFAGVDDAIEKRHNLDFFGAGRFDKNLVVLMHEPDIADEMPRHISLQLSGHSHGGQVCLEKGKPIFPPPLGEKYVAGFYQEGEAPVPLYVTRGVGTTGFDIRFRCPPEVSILTLTSA
ncbi:MAG TPA: metallophosphoesterase [Fimbriimonadaceae bacterium]|nr:metallophosphoesterase [Fimbriimonadaceae bacterium]